MTFQNTMKWVEQELKNGRNDTVHDFLAYLAEQMIAMNKEKNEEIKGFLKWLEREIGAEIKELSNKTAIKEYHDHSFVHLLEVLKRNKKKISLDTSDRIKQELIENHFLKSIAILEPLKNSITATDDLIDKIVYKLYELTQEEIQIIESG